MELAPVGFPNGSKRIGVFPEKGEGEKWIAVILLLPSRLGLLCRGRFGRSRGGFGSLGGSGSGGF